MNSYGWSAGPSLFVIGLYSLQTVGPIAIHISAVFSDFAAHLLDRSCGPGGWPEILVSDTGQIFKRISGSELCILV